MPDFKKILSIDSSRITIDITAETVGENLEYFAEIINFAFTDKYPINARATRVLEVCTKNKPKLFSPYINEAIIKYPNFKTDGLKRIFPKIFIISASQISTENKMKLIDTCFKYLLSEKESPAVRTNCMQLIYNFSDNIPEIKGELEASIEFIFENSPTSIKSRAKKILSKLNNV